MPIKFKPMLLSPTGKDYLWGGNRLKSEYNKNLDVSPLAETWECSSHRNGPSIINSGEFIGVGLDEILKIYPELLGEKYKNLKELPILVKLIDANKELSVQVHPNDEYARIYENQNGKTEMWYVLEALPNSTLICGFAHTVTAQQLKNDIEIGQLEKHLQKIKVKKGDVFFIEPGTIHAIGAGVVIAEIQQNSDVTYRVYDYDRIDKNGNKRELHFEKALKVLNMKSSEVLKQKPRLIKYNNGSSQELLALCEYFKVEKVQISKEYSFISDNLSFQVLICLEGEGRLEISNMDKPLEFKKGDCIFIPANIGECYLLGNMELLKVNS